MTLKEIAEKAAHSEWEAIEELRADPPGRATMRAFVEMLRCGQAHDWLPTARWAYESLADRIEKEIEA